MNTSYTPGPWKAEKGVEGDSDRWIIVSAAGTPWLLATIENGQPGDCCETEGKTACLMAAAPKLLAAVESIITAFERNGPTDWSTAIALARSAAAEAKGASLE